MEDPFLLTDKRLPDAAKANLGADDKLTACLHSAWNTDSTQEHDVEDGVWMVCVCVYVHVLGLIP